MTRPSTEDGDRTIADIAARHGFSAEAGRAMAAALAAGGGSMAQFSHRDLGGMGQWSEGGMLMIGDMFNHSLKARVGSLAEELADAARRGDLVVPPQAARALGGLGRWWPADLGDPSSSGAQNGQRYAVFPGKRRLVVERNGRMTLHDTGDRRIGGVSQQQGAGQDLRFSSDQGSVSIEDLPEIRAAEPPPPKRGPDRARALPAVSDFTWGPAEAASPSSPQAASAATKGDPAPKQTQPSPTPATGRGERPAADLLDLIRKLAELRNEGLLTDEEFSSKKKELLARI